MSRVTNTKDVALGTYGAAGVLLTQLAADAGNFQQFPLTGSELIVAYNSGGSTRTVTITSVADDRGRSGSIAAENILAGVSKVYGPFKKKEGWQQTNGMLYFQASHADVKFTVIKLP